MNRVAVMSFPDALRKKPFQETDWRFLGIVLVFLILLAALATLANRTLNFPEPVLTADTAAFYVDLLLEEEKAPLEEVEVETEDVGAGVAAEDEELPPEEVGEEEAAPAPAEESVVEATQREEAAREIRRQAAGARAEKARAAQAAALEQSGLLAMLTVAAPTAGGTRRGTGTSGPGTGAADVGAFGVADLGADFGITADLSKDRRVVSRIGTSKKDLKVQMAKAKELEAKMTEAEVEAAEALADAQLEVKMSGLSKVEEIAKTTPGRDPDAIEAMITQHRAQIAHCYETELRKNPGLKGKIVVRFTVRANGRVTGAKVIQSTMGNAKVERCIVQVIRRFKFDVVGREKGNLTYEYPFIFAH